MVSPIRTVSYRKSTHRWTATTRQRKSLRLVDDDGGGPLDPFPIDGTIDSLPLPSPHLFQIIAGLHCRSESHRSATIDNHTSNQERISIEHSAVDGSPRSTVEQGYFCFC